MAGILVLVGVIGGVILGTWRLGTRYGKRLLKVASILYVIPIIQLDADACRFQFRDHFPGVRGVLFADGKYGNLHGREPKRKCTGIVLDENAKKPLH